MRKILVILTILFVLNHFNAKTTMKRFLSETVADEPIPGEVAPEGEPHAHEGGHEEEGIELHYAPGTKGFWVCVGISIFLTSFAGIMSGLTVGLLSIDTLDLEMKMIHGTEEQKRLAATVLPILNKHHYLLVTLLLCNAFAMEALPIFLDAIVPAFWAIIISVTAVLFFGEIIPQAVCTGPQQLKIASCVAPSVNFLMICVGIIAYPISKILDWLLGEHHAIRYTNNDLKALIELHSLTALHETIGGTGSGGFGLQAYQTKMIQGAIDIQGNKVKDVMIPFDRVYSIRIGKKIDFKAAKKISKYGYSRIPVFMNKDRHCIIGYLLIKTLVGVDLSRGLTLRELMNESTVTLRRPLYVSPNEDIGPLMTKFKNGRSHMAIVTDNQEQMEHNMKKYLDDDGSVISDSSKSEDEKDEKPKVLGIITLEDIIESALKEDILDEADYDIEHNPNLAVNPLENSVMGEPGQPLQTNNLHKVIKDKVEKRLGRKNSELLQANTLNKIWFEMGDMNENLLDPKNASSQAKNPEIMSSN